MKDMTAAIIIKDKKILLVHNTKYGTLRIEPPGGKKEDNESLEDCAIREVEEEIGVKIKILKLFEVSNTNSPEGEFKVYMHLSEITNGEIKLKEPEKISSYGWYSLQDLLELKEREVLVPNLCSAIENIRNLLT